MTKEDKELLLKDLCARLPYAPIIKIEEHDWNNLHIDAYDTPFSSYYLEPFIIGEIAIKPYLRPMSNMTEEEIDEAYWLQQDSIHIKEYKYEGGYEKSLDYVYLSEFIDWLNAHHFDYRGLIEKSLAIIAPDNMYK